MSPVKKTTSQTLGPPSHALVAGLDGGPLITELPAAGVEPLHGGPDLARVSRGARSGFRSSGWWPTPAMSLLERNVDGPLPDIERR